MKRKQKSSGNFSVEIIKKMHKWMPGGLLALVLVCFMQFSFISQAVDGTITASSVKIRENANSVSTVLGSVTKGSTVDIIGKVTAADGYVWYQVYVDADTKGFIRSDLITTTATVSTITVTTAETTQIATIIADGVWVRDQASTTGKLLTSLSKGMNVTITGTSGDWSCVNFVLDGSLVEGYIWSDYLQNGDVDTTVAATTAATTATTAATTTATTAATTTAATTTAVATTDTNTGYTQRSAVVQNNGVRVRAAATTSAEMIASADKGQTVTVTGEETDTAGKLWYKIKLTFNGAETTGYVLSDFLVVEQPAVTDTTTGNAAVDATGTTGTDAATGDTTEADTGAVVSGDTDTVNATTDNSATEPAVAADGSITVSADIKTKSSDKTILWVIQILILVIIIGTFVYLRLTDYVDNKDNQAYKKKIKNLNQSGKVNNLSKAKKTGSILPQPGRQTVKAATKVTATKPAEAKNFNDDYDEDEEIGSAVPEKEVASVEKKPKIASFTDTADDEEDMELLFLHGDKFD